MNKGRVPISMQERQPLCHLSSSRAGERALAQGCQSVGPAAKKENTSTWELALTPHQKSSSELSSPVASPQLLVPASPSSAAASPAFRIRHVEKWRRRGPPAGPGSRFLTRHAYLRPPRMSASSFTSSPARLRTASRSFSMLVLLMRSSEKYCPCRKGVHVRCASAPSINALRTNATVASDHANSPLVLDESHAQGWKSLTARFGHPFLSDSFRL